MSEWEMHKKRESSSPQFNSPKARFYGSWLCAKHGEAKKTWKVDDGRWNWCLTFCFCYKDWVGMQMVSDGTQRRWTMNFRWFSFFHVDCCWRSTVGKSRGSDDRKQKKFFASFSSFWLHDDIKCLVGRSLRTSCRDWLLNARLHRRKC